jgi:hypothetical protein
VSEPTYKLEVLRDTRWQQYGPASMYTRMPKQAAEARKEIAERLFRMKFRVVPEREEGDEWGDEPL